MKINEAAKRSGLRQPTIRLYEERGLISPELEEKNGRMFRDYSEADVERLKVIGSLRKALFSMEQIKLMFDDPALIPALLESHKKKVDSLSEELLSLKHALDDLEDTPESPEALAAALESSAAGAMPLPKADISPRFRYLDELYPPTGHEDDGRLKVPEVTFSKKWYFLTLGIVLLVSLVWGVRSVNSAKEQPYSIYLHVGSGVIAQYLCESDAIPPKSDNRTWHYRNARYPNTDDFANLVFRQSEGTVRWSLYRHYYKMDANLAPTIPTRLTAEKTISADGSVHYTVDDAPGSSGTVPCQDLDAAIAAAEELDEPLPSLIPDILLALLRGLILAALASGFFFRGALIRSFTFYLAPFHKVANAGYEAANYIDDPEHIYGPRNTDR